MYDCDEKMFYVLKNIVFVLNKLLTNIIFNRRSYARNVREIYLEVLIL